MKPTLPIDTGYLELIVGPMFSGKTSRLIQLQKMYSICDMSTCVVNYENDTRYHESKLSTHDQQMIECLRLQNIEELRKVISLHDVFLINEFQFFDDQQLVCIVKELVEKHHKIVHMCGLDGTFERKPFGSALCELLPFADSVVKLHAICKKCKANAFFSKRIVKSNDVVVIGGEEMYIPVCRKCYLE